MHWHSFEFDVRYLATAHLTPAPKGVVTSANTRRVTPLQDALMSEDARAWLQVLSVFRVVSACGTWLYFSPSLFVHHLGCLSGWTRSGSPLAVFAGDVSDSLSSGDPVRSTTSTTTMASPTVSKLSSVSFLSYL